LLNLEHVRAGIVQRLLGNKLGPGTECLWQSAVCCVHVRRLRRVELQVHLHATCIIATLTRNRLATLPQRIIHCLVLELARANCEVWTVLCCRETLDLTSKTLARTCDPRSKDSNGSAASGRQSATSICECAACSLAAVAAEGPDSWARCAASNDLLLEREKTS
jgi:hypothetical protein